MDDAAKKEAQPAMDGAEAAQTSPMRKLILVSSIAAGIQFGWALQLSLLTPYVQLLGIPHTWAPFIWLCGPISGMLVQPTVGYYSDRSTSRFGRRRPYIAAGAALVSVAVFLIGYAADIGRSLGDPSAPGTPKPRAIAIFVVGFWVLDVANNMLQGPCRALLADLAEGDRSKTRTSFAFYTFFIAVGSVLGYAAGSYSRLHRLFPFSRTDACDDYCANLKSCFFISIALLLTLTTLALSLVSEKRFVSPEPNTTTSSSSSKPPRSSSVPFFGEMFEALKGLDKPMWVLLLVTCLNWIAWFPFLLFDTDWMGKEVYGGKVGEGRNYHLGVRAGALGLVLNSVVCGAASLGIETLARWVGGAKRLWGIVNLLMAVCLAMTVVVTKMAEHARHDAVAAADVPLPPVYVKAAALALFALLGIPFAVTLSIPFALASIFSTSSGAGQGLSLGILNLAIVIPQMFVSLTSGPWDDLFGGGNLPAFVVGAIAAAASAILSLWWPPYYRSPYFHRHRLKPRLMPPSPAINRSPILDIYTCFLFYDFLAFALLFYLLFGF